MASTARAAQWQRPAPVPGGRIIRLLATAVIPVGLTAVVLRFVAAPLDRYDEGIPVVKGMLINAGAVPYRDFFVGYGPLDSYLLGAFFRVFGLEVLVERLLAAIVTVLFTAAGWWLCGVLRLRPPMRILMTGLLSLAAVGIPMLTPTVLANLIGLCAFACFFLFLERGSWRLAVATGLWTGLASFARPEFAAVLGIGLLVGYAILVVLRQEGAGQGLAGYLLGAAGTVALLWTPMVLVAGRAAVFFNVVGVLSINAQGRSIPLGQGPDGPAVVLFSLCFGAIWLWGIGQAILNRRHPPELARLAAPLVSAVLAFGWVLGRADAPHALGAWPLTAVLLSLIMARRQTPALSPRAGAVISLLAACLFSGAVVALASRDLARPAASIDVPHAAVVGSRAWIPASELAALVRTIDAAVPAGDPILVGLQRNDEVLFNDAMLYFLAGRRPGTAYWGYVPGLTTDRNIQQTMACQLTRSGTRLAVLGPNGAGEPWNASARPGSSVLDDWLRGHTVARVDRPPYALLWLRLDPAERACQP